MRIGWVWSDHADGLPIDPLWRLNVRYEPGRWVPSMKMQKVDLSDLMAQDAGEKPDEVVIDPLEQQLKDAWIHAKVQFGQHSQLTGTCIRHIYTLLEGHSECDETVDKILEKYRL